MATTCRSPGARMQRGERPNDQPRDPRPPASRRALPWPPSCWRQRRPESLATTNAPIAETGGMTATLPLLGTPLTVAVTLDGDRQDLRRRARSEHGPLEDEVGRRLRQVHEHRRHASRSPSRPRAASSRSRPRPSSWATSSGTGTGPPMSSGPGAKSSATTPSARTARQPDGCDRDRLRRPPGIVWTPGPCPRSS